MAMTYAELGYRIAVLDEERSPSVCTVIYRAFVAHMIFLVDQTVTRWQDCQGTVSPDVAKFWLDAYRAAEQPVAVPFPDVSWRHIYAAVAFHRMIGDGKTEWCDVGHLAVSMADNLLESLADKPEPETESEEPAPTTQDDGELRRRYRETARTQHVRVRHDAHVGLDYDEGAWVQARVWIDKASLPSKEG